MRYILAAALLAGGLARGQDPAALSLKTRIPLAGVNGRIDHFAVDLKGQRLFVSALGNHTGEIIDVPAARRVKTLSGLEEPQGQYYDASANRLFIATGDGATRIYDGTTLQMLTKLTFSGDADNVRYDARSARVVVGYGEGRGALAFLDSAGKQSEEIPVDAHPESFQLERNGTRVFINVPDRREIEAADVGSRAILARWPTTAAASCFPMALDEAHHRLFTGCRAPARLLVFDMASGKMTTSAEIVGDTDDLFYDAARSRVYVIGGQGFIDVLQQKDPDHYERIARYPTAPGARTGLFVPEWSTLFVAVPHRGSQAAEILVYQAK